MRAALHLHPLSQFPPMKTIPMIIYLLLLIFQSHLTTSYKHTNNNPPPYYNNIKSPTPPNFYTFHPSPSTNNNNNYTPLSRTHNFLSFPAAEFWSKTNPQSTISFSFSTTTTLSSLLFYTDLPPTPSFYELKLINGQLQLRFNPNPQSTLTSKTLNLGNHLNDGNWHSVVVNKQKSKSSILLDSFISQEISYDEIQQTVVNVNGTSPPLLFFSSLPNTYSSNLMLLSLPSSYFEPPFTGTIKNIKINNQNNPEPINSIHNSPEFKPCDNNVCLNGGICWEEIQKTMMGTSSNNYYYNNFVCECNQQKDEESGQQGKITFEGDYCERALPITPPTLHFPSPSTSSLTFNLAPKPPLLSSTDTLTLVFKTTSTSGQIFHSGHLTDFLSLSIYSSKLLVSINLGGGTVDTIVGDSHTHSSHHNHHSGPRSPTNSFGGYLDTTGQRWNEIIIKRRVQEMTKSTSLCHVSASLNSYPSSTWTLSGPFNSLSVSTITLGSNSPTTSGIKACFKEAKYTTSTLTIDLLKSALSNSPLINTSGGVSGDCSENDDNQPLTKLLPHTIPSTPLKFTTPDSYIWFPIDSPLNANPNFDPYNPPHDPFSLNLKSSFLTSSNSGTVFHYSTSQSHINFEIYDSKFYLTLNLPGFRSMKIENLQQNGQNSPKWRTVLINYSDGSGKFEIDGDAVEFNLKRTLNNYIEQEHNLRPGLYVGGLKFNVQGIWSSEIGVNGVIGCFKEIYLNGDSVDLSKKERDEATIRPGCSNSNLHPQLHQQPQSPNLPQIYPLQPNQIEEDENYSQDNTICTPPTCLTFDGTNYISITPPSAPLNLTTQLISFSFKTTRTNGLLAFFGAEPDPTGPHLAILIEFTRVKIVLKLGDSGEKVWSLGSGLNDGMWHRVWVERWGGGGRVRAGVDNYRHEMVNKKSSSNYGGSYIEGDLPLRYPQHQTSPHHHHNQQQHPSTSPLSTSSIYLTSIILSSFPPTNLLLTPHFPPFAGYIRSLTHNSIHLLPLLPTLTYKSNLLPLPPPPPNNLISFNSSSYLTLPQLLNSHYLNLIISLQLKTHQNAHSVIFYNGGGKDFILLQLTPSGQLIYKYSKNDKTLQFKSGRIVNDGDWHQIFIWRRINWGDRMINHGFSVDGGNEIKNEGIDLHNGEYAGVELKGVFYLGGLPPTLYTPLSSFSKSTPNQILSNYTGCLASINLNTLTHIPSNSLTPIPPSIQLNKCQTNDHQSSSSCPLNYCSNNGQCSLNPSTFSPFCNCELTSFIGPTCNTHAERVEFKPGEKLVYDNGRSLKGFKEEKVGAEIVVNKFEKWRKSRKGGGGVKNLGVFRIQGEEEEEYVKGEISPLTQMFSITLSIPPSSSQTLTYPQPLKTSTPYIIKYTRSNSNITIQINQGPIINYDIKEATLNNKKNSLILHDVKSIELGGGVFQGTLSGVSINKIRPLEMIGDAGRVEWVKEEDQEDENENYPQGVGLPRQHSRNDLLDEEKMQKSAPSNNPPPPQLVILTSDSLVTPSCPSIDDESCIHSSYFDNNNNNNAYSGDGPTDDLITPVYTYTGSSYSSTTRPHGGIHKSPGQKHKHPLACLDDEDCDDSSYVEGSGMSTVLIDKIDDSSTLTPPHHHQLPPNGGNIVTTTNNNLNHITTEIYYNHTLYTNTELDKSTIIQTTPTTTPTLATTTLPPWTPPTTPSNRFIPTARLFNFFDPPTSKPGETNLIESGTLSPPPKPHQPNQPKNSYIAEAGDSTLVIIIIIALLLIIIVSILIIFFMCKRAGGLQGEEGGVSGGVYKGEGKIEYGKSGIMGGFIGGGTGAGMIGERQGRGGKGVEGVKEWYV